MPRLRTTTALSLLALIAGVAATGWLSGRTEQWLAASPAALLAAPQPARAARPVHGHRARASHLALAPARRAPAPTRAPPDAASAAAEAAPVPALIPLSTPAAATPYAQLRGHLDGRVLLRVAIDGHGRVEEVAVARSSGDPVLDQHATEVVAGWRFAVPSDHPDGLTGQLPMRFDSGAPLARTP